MLRSLPSFALSTALALAGGLVLTGLVAVEGAP